MDDHSTLLRPNRSQLSVPAIDPRKIDKALASAADALFLDLEDSVDSARKEEARQFAVESLLRDGWGNRDRAVRINPVESRWCLQDVIAVMEAAGAAVDRLVVPKVQTAGDVHFLDRLLSGLESDLARDCPVLLEVQIEDPLGLHNLEAIASASSRISHLTFGQGDFAAAAGMPAVDIGVDDEWDAAVSGDRWLFPRQQIVLTAVRHDLRALNGSYANFRDHDGFRAYCRMSRALGFTGTWCIHPDQIAIANDVWTPTADEIARAQAIIDALENAGAIGHGGTMIDEASVRMARRTLNAGS